MALGHAPKRHARLARRAASAVIRHSDTVVSAARQGRCASALESYEAMLVNYGIFAANLVAVGKRYSPYKSKAATARQAARRALNDRCRLG